MTLATQNAALTQQLDITAEELERCKRERSRLSTSREELSKKLANAQLLISKLRAAADAAGIDLSTVKLPSRPRGPRSRAGRRVLPRALRRPNRRKRAALRAAQRRREAAFRASERQRERTEREEYRAAQRKRNFSALVAVRRALPATEAGLEVANIYFPPELIKRVRYAAIERTHFLKLLNESLTSDDEWPADVLPIRGISGVVAQVLSDYFAEREAMMEEQRNEGRL